MSWSRRSPSPDDDSDAPNEPNPLADNIRLNRPQRTGGNAAQQDTQRTASIFDQQTVVDKDFSGRKQARRQRQGGLPFNTPQFGTWAADPGNSRKLLIVGAAVVIFLLLIGAISIVNRLGRNAAVDPATLPSAAPALGGGITVGSPAASTDATFGTALQPAQTIPGTDPAQQSTAPTAAGAFVVSGTETQGLFLRQDHTTTAQILGTLPEGTRSTLR